PPWLQTAYPEIAAERATGQPVPWGARQEIDYTHPAFLFHAERVIRRILQRYAAHPAVIGYQVDNEPGLELFYNQGVFTQFVRHLRSRFGDVETLNREWGLTYWSHRLGDWNELWRPDGNTFPQYDLAWRRFQAHLTSEFIEWQASIVREYARPDQFVTTCLQYPRRGIDDRELCQALDVTAGNPYYGMQDRLNASLDLPPLNYWTTSGVAGLIRQADRLFSSKQARYLVTETNAQSIDDASNNYPPYPGQLAQAAFAFLARGAAMIEYWHWHSIPYGAETYWGGVLPHSLVPGRVYREVSQIGQRLDRLGPLLNGFEPDGDVLLLWSNPSRYALQFMPPFSIDGHPDSESFEHIFDAFHAGVIAAGRQARIMHPEQARATGAAELARRFPVLVAAGLYIAADDDLAFLREYVEAGGHLIVGVRTGYADEQARARVEVAPPRLTEPAGAYYEEFSNIEHEIPVRSGSPDMPVSPDAAALFWLEGLLTDRADVLVKYEHPRFADFAAVTTHAHGAGRVTAVGCVPNGALAVDLIRWAAPERLSNAFATEVASPLTVMSGSTPDRGRIWFVFNWGWREVSLVLAGDVMEPDTGDGYAAGQRLALGPWDCRVFVSSDEPIVRFTSTSSENPR
ncbi:MAG: beta-galactosidase, partial [Micrococcales bacterium]|nr:beta-galactosidase [Micrococcales bacterium]